MLQLATTQTCVSFTRTLQVCTGVSCRDRDWESLQDLFGQSDLEKYWSGLFSQMGPRQKQWQQLSGVWLPGTGDGPSIEENADRLIRNSQPQYRGALAYRVALSHLL